MVSSIQKVYEPLIRAATRMHDGFQVYGSCSGRNPYRRLPPAATRRRLDHCFQQRDAEREAQKNGLSFASSLHAPAAVRVFSKTPTTEPSLPFSS